MLYRLQKPASQPIIKLTSTNRIWSFIQPFLKRHQSKLFLHVFFVMAASASGAIIPYLLKLLVDHVDSNKDSNTNFVQQFLFITGLIILSRIISMAFWFLADTADGNIKISLGNDVRLALVNYAHKHSATFFEQNLSGDLSQKINNATLSVRRLCEIVILNFGYVFFRALTTLIMMFITHLYLGSAVTLTIILVIIAMYYIGQNIEKHSETKTDIHAHINGQIVDSIANSLLIKLFSGHKSELSYLKRKSNDLMNKEAAFYRIDRNSDTAKLSLETLLFLVSFVTAALLYINNMTSFGTVVMGMTYGFNLMDEFYNLSSRFLDLSENLGSIRSAIKTLLTPITVSDKKNAQKAQISKGDITFENISFSYNKDLEILGKTPFNLTIPAHQKLALIGPSGAGKSTLVNLLLRFYDVKTGHIAIDGQDISDITQDSLRQQISIIPQDTSLFHRSLMDNIRYGRLNATDKEVIVAAKKAHAHDFIKNLPDGYETLVGERGVRLSGGQRQRIAIARAILKDAPILILDEATSALDSESEQAIQDALKKIMKNKTVIAIAHRLSTIAHMDRVIVMDQGQIVEDGDHATLIKKKKGLYAKLWKHQSGGFIGMD